MDPATLNVGDVVNNRTICAITRSPEGTFVQFSSDGAWVNASSLVPADAPAPDLPASLEPDLSIEE